MLRRCFGIILDSLDFLAMKWVIFVGGMVIVPPTQLVYCVRLFIQAAIEGLICDGDLHSILDYLPWPTSIGVIIINFIIHLALFSSILLSADQRISFCTDFYAANVTVLRTN